MNDKHCVSLDISQLKKSAEQEENLKRDLSEGPVKVTVYGTDGNKISFDGKDHFELEGGKLVMTPYFDWIGEAEVIRKKGNDDSSEHKDE